MIRSRSPISDKHLVKLEEFLLLASLSAPSTALLRGLVDRIRVLEEVIERNQQASENVKQ